MEYNNHCSCLKYVTVFWKWSSLSFLIYFHHYSERMTIKAIKWYCWFWSTVPMKELLLIFLNILFKLSNYCQYKMKKKKTLLHIIFFLDKMRNSGPLVIIVHENLTCTWRKRLWEQINSGIQLLKAKFTEARWQKAQRRTHFLY